MVFNMKKSLKVICCIAGCLIFKATIADEVKMYNSLPTADELAQKIFPEEIKGVKPRGMKPDWALPPKTARSGIGMSIQFAYNSAEIMSESFPYLDQIGLMLKMEKLSNAKLLIEGYTDASGSVEHNKLLSEERARAVDNYLISKYDISPNRLIISGKGESRLLNEKDPMDPLNRRVEFYKAE